MSEAAGDVKSVKMTPHLSFPEVNGIGVGETVLTRPVCDCSHFAVPPDVP